MIVTALKAGQPYRLQRTFKTETYLIIQVRFNFNLVIAHDQGSAKNGIAGVGIIVNPPFNANNVIPDGLVLTSTTTGPPNGLPYDFFWQGELWYAADQDNALFSIEMGTETSQRR